MLPPGDGDQGLAAVELAHDLLDAGWTLVQPSQLGGRAEDQVHVPSGQAVRAAAPQDKHRVVRVGHPVLVTRTSLRST